jgi:hypothetical protein
MMPPPATTGPRRALLTAMVGICAVLNLSLLTQLILSHASLNSDFMAFWSFPRFASENPVRLLYDANALQSFQKALYPHFGSFYPYLYPPTLLLLTWWLRFFSFQAAEILWTLAGLILFTATVPMLFPRHRTAILTALLASPAALINIATGETAFFTSALLFAGFALLPRRQILAGFAFGLLTLKPQLGILIPIFLLARGTWPAIFAASLTALGLAALSCLAFPPDLWRLWADTLPQYQTNYFSATTLNLNIIVTPAANLVVLGVAPRIAWVVQFICGMAVAALVFLLARRSAYRLAMAALLVGTFLAQPHAYAYDTVTVPAAMALCFTPRTPGWLVALGALAYLAPLLLLSPLAPYYLGAVPLALLFGGIIALACGARPGAISAHAPDLSSPAG